MPTGIATGRPGSLRKVKSTPPNAHNHAYIELSLKKGKYIAEDMKCKY